MRVLFLTATALLALATGSPQGTPGFRGNSYLPAPRNPSDMYGPPNHTPGTPIGAANQAYPTSSYPSSTSGYPSSSGGYPSSTSSYPSSSSGYPSNRDSSDSSYPRPNSNRNQGYPTSINSLLDDDTPSNNANNYNNRNRNNNRNNPNSGIGDNEYPIPDDKRISNGRLPEFANQNNRFPNRFGGNNNNLNDAFPSSGPGGRFPSNNGNSGQGNSRFPSNNDFPSGSGSSGGRFPSNNNGFGNDGGRFPSNDFPSGPGNSGRFPSNINDGGRFPSNGGGFGNDAGRFPSNDFPSGSGNNGRFPGGNNDGGRFPSNNFPSGAGNNGRFPNDDFPNRQGSGRFPSNAGGNFPSGSGNDRFPSATGSNDGQNNRNQNNRFNDNGSQNDRFPGSNRPSGGSGFPSPNSGVVDRFTGNNRNNNNNNNRNQPNRNDNNDGNFPGSGGSQGDPLSEPANYGFSYEVRDSPSGQDFGHQEQRRGDDTRGSYFVNLPDGRLQKVTYTAGVDGYHAEVTYELPPGGLIGGDGAFPIPRPGGQQRISRSSDAKQQPRQKRRSSWHENRRRRFAFATNRQ